MALGDSAQLTPTNISITCSFAMNFQNYSVNMSVEDKDDNFVTSTGHDRTRRKVQKDEQEGNH
jgi:hypothetical protein